MKILAQLFMALLGGIVAIILYRAFESDSSPENRGRHAGRNSFFGARSADSLNNVFNVGFGEAAESTLEQVVHIRSKIASAVPRDPFFEFFGDGFWDPRYRNEQRPQQRLQEASGSGVIVSADGYIVTNNHVVDRAQEIIVSLYNGRAYRAEIKGTDPSTDLAVLKIDEKGLPEAKLADSDEVR